MLVRNSVCLTSQSNTNKHVLTQVVSPFGVGFCYLVRRLDWNSCDKAKGSTSSHRISETDERQIPWAGKDLELPSPVLVLHDHSGGGRGGVPAEGPGGPKRLHKAPTNNTKPQQTIQSPNRLYKPPTDYTKPRKDYTNTQNIRQNLTILNKNPKYETRVANNNSLTSTIKYPIFKTPYIK